MATLGSLKTISGIKNVVNVPVTELKPGMFTVDGVIINVTRQGDTTAIEHRNTTYVEANDDTVQVYAQLDQESTAFVLDTLASE